MSSAFSRSWIYHNFLLCAYSREIIDMFPHLTKKLVLAFSRTLRPATFPAGEIWEQTCTGFGKICKQFVLILQNFHFYHSILVKFTNFLLALCTTKGTPRSILLKNKTTVQTTNFNQWRASRQTLPHPSKHADDTVSWSWQFALLVFWELAHGDESFFLVSQDT